MPLATYGEALARAFGSCLEEDESVYLLGAGYGGLTSARTLFENLTTRFPKQVVEPPWSELGVTGAGIGAAANGLRPVVDLVTASFIFQGFAQVVNEAANAYYSSGGQTSMPVVFHVLAGIRGGGGAQHQHTPQAMLWNTPGLEIMLPSSPSEVYGLVRTAILHSNNPTVFVDHPLLLASEEEVDWDAEPIPFGKARVARTGDAVTVVATSIMVSRALEAADTLSREHGIEIEVIDPRTLVPLDEEAIMKSIAKTGRFLVADECHQSCGVASELVSRAVESCFADLKCAPRRVVTPDVPVPFGPSMEAAVVPSAAKIVEGVIEMMAKCPPAA